MNKSVLKKCIVLTGPVGVGKSLLSNELKKKTELPCIIFDIMRHAPMTIENIRQNRQFVLNKIAELEQELALANPQRCEEIKKEIAGFKNAVWVSEEQEKIRTLLPKLPNYEMLGYDERVSRYIQDNSEKYGVSRHIAWHYYQKRFEIELFKAMTEQLQTPAILDLGGGVPVCLTKDYEVFDKVAKQILKDQRKFEEKYPFTKKDLKTAFPYSPKECQKETLHMFDCFPSKNIVSLHLADDYMQNSARAKHEPLNEKFVNSGFYDMVSGTKINTNGMQTANGIDSQVVSEIAAKIIEKTQVEVLAQ